jgi:hypothetical protein
MVIVAWIWDVFLRYGGEVGDGVGNRVGAAEGEDQARVGRGMRQSNVAAGVRQERSSVPCLDISAPHAPHATHCWMRRLTVTNSKVSKSRSPQWLRHLKGF